MNPLPDLISPQTWHTLRSDPLAALAFDSSVAPRPTLTTASIAPLPVAPWTAEHARAALTTLAAIHAAAWQPPTDSSGLPHALAGDLFESARDGLSHMQQLGGWPAVLLPDHVTQMAAIVADPDRVLAPLRALPATIIHRQPWRTHWRRTNNNTLALSGWALAAIGPALWDLVAFIERLGLLQSDTTLIEAKPPLTTDELATHYFDQLDAYHLPHFNRAAFRAVWPAALVVHTITHWLPQFAVYFGRLKPSPMIWRTFAKFPPAMLDRIGIKPIIDTKAYFAAAFQRFDAAASTLL